VYRCDLVEGIRRGLLSPFHYFGVPDEVDYRNIPWRSSRFNDVALTQAMATQVRAQNALEQYRQRGGQRTLAFCCSQRHADFMAEFFHAAGVRSVAVHAGATSAPRALSLEQLRDGALDVIFAVDMFNEGVDLPNVDTVMMLRPTESPIVWLQQFGRGLRRTEGKDHLAVIDYIGNHRIFLVKPRTLFELGPGDAEIERTLNQLRAGNVELPPGCEVTYDLQTVEIMKGLLRLAKPDDALRLYYTDFQERVGVRPRAVEVFHDGYTPRAARRSYGSWLRLVRAMGDLSPAQQAVLQQTGDFLDELEITPMSKSYKMLLLLTMLKAGRVPGYIGIADLVVGFRDLAARSAKLRTDVGAALDSPQRLRHLLETNPIAAWTGGKGTGGTAYFAYDGETFRTTLSVAPELVDPLQELVREIVEWRLAEYLERVEDGPVAEGRINCKVSHAGGRPMLFLPDRAKHPGIPEGWTDVTADGERYKANFVKVAVNVMRRPGSEQNELPGVLRRWFGPDAGLPGTSVAVVFEPASEGYTLSPLGEAVR
jgi:hypothetical protein